jgi:hypothetical protein
LNRGLTIDIYRIDNFRTASTHVGTASIDCQIHLLADVGNTEKERKRVERKRIDCLVFKLATVALPINANPYYNHNPPMEEHS